MFSKKLFLCIALIPIFAEAIGEQFLVQPQPYGPLMFASPYNFAAANQMANQGGNAQYVLQPPPPPPPLPPPPPQYMQGIQQNMGGFPMPQTFMQPGRPASFPMPSPGTMQGMQSQMPNNNFRQPLLLLVMSAYSRLLALTQLAMQSMMSPSITGPQTTQPPADEILKADALQTVQNEMLQLQRKQSGRQDGAEEKPISEENKVTNTTPKDDGEEEQPQTPVKRKQRKLK